MSKSACILVLALPATLLPGTALGQDAPATPPAAPAEAPASAPTATTPAATTTPTAEAAKPTETSATAAAAAEEPAPPPTKVGGFVEIAYHRNLSAPHQIDPVGMHVYDTAAANSFVLHAAHVTLNHSFTDAVSATLELEGGVDAAYTNGSSVYPGNTVSGNWFDFQEAYAQLKKSGFTVTAGRFATYAGIEVMKGPLNPTITRGYLYGFAEAFTHTGAKVHYSAGPVDIGVGVVNGWDHIVDVNDRKTLIWRVGVTPADMFWAALSGSWGAEQPRALDAADPNNRLSVDLTGAVIPSETITVNFQGNYGKESHAALDGTGAQWMGAGLQPVLHFGDASIGARVEWFQDDGGARTAPLVADAKPKVSYMNYTVAPGYTFDGGFTVRAELRMDTANKAVFARDGGVEKSQATVAASVHYLF